MISDISLIFSPVIYGTMKQICIWIPTLHEFLHKEPMYHIILFK